MRALLVHLDLDGANRARLAVAGDLAARCGASLTGIAACDPQPAPYFYGAYGDQLLGEDRGRVAEQLHQLEAAFRAALAPGGPPAGWRSAVAPPLGFVARECRTADLVIVGAPAGGLGNPSRQLDVASLCLEAGRPLLVVPGHAGSAPSRRAIVAWKDCREARRAVADALPLLRLGEGAVVAAFDESGNAAAARASADDVAVFLRAHGVAAETFVGNSSGNVGADLARMAGEQGADLIVAGAYGHSRLSEWVFGGVTRALLAEPPCCLLLSH